MNVERQMAHMTCRILAKKADGSQHCGTGFFVGYEIAGDRHKIFCVTNRHVLHEAIACSIPITLASDDNGPLYGNGVRLDISDLKDAAIFHPEPEIDLAAFPVHGVLNQLGNKGHRPFFRMLSRKDLPESDFFTELDVATDILMIGYPNGLWDENNNMPIIRRGSTATSPSLDFNGKRQFVIDCACFPGSSGSPILTYQTMGYRKGDTLIMGGPPRIVLIGILFAGPQFSISGALVPKAIPTSLTVEVQSLMMMHLGYCIKSTEIKWLDEFV